MTFLFRDVPPYRFLALWRTLQQSQYLALDSLFIFCPETAQAQANFLPFPLSTLSLCLVLFLCVHLLSPLWQIGTISNWLLLARNTGCRYQLLSDALHLSWVNQSQTHLLTRDESSLKALQAMILPTQPGYRSSPARWPVPGTLD